MICSSPDVQAAFVESAVSGTLLVKASLELLLPTNQPTLLATLHLACSPLLLPRCLERWSGLRCELVDGLNVRVDYFRQSTLLYERTLIIIGIVIAALVFIVICIASYILANGRRKRFEQRRRRREARRAARELEATAPPPQEKHLANDVSIKESPLRSAALAAADGSTTTALQPNNAYPAQHEIHPLLLKKQQQQQQQQQQQKQQFENDEPDPQLQALLRSCDPNHQSKAEGHVAGERPDSRKRLVASSYDNCEGVPSTFKACVDRNETTTAAVLHTTEDIEMNDMDRNGEDKHLNLNSPGGNSGQEGQLERPGGPSRDDIGVPLSLAETDVNSPPQVSSPTSSSCSARPPSSGSLSPPPYHRAVYIPSPLNHQLGEDDPPEEEAAKIPLLSSNEIKAPKGQLSIDEVTISRFISPSNESQRKRTSFQKNHAPPLHNVREWSSAPTPEKSKASDSPILIHRLDNDTEKGYDSDEDMITERDNLLGKTSPPQIKKSKNPHAPSIFPTASSVSHSNTFPKPSRVNGVVRGSSTSHNSYPNDSDDESSSSDENDAPREFPYQKQRDDLYISEDDLDLSKENLASTSFSSDIMRSGRMPRQLSRQESRDMEEPVVGLLPSQNLKPPRDQLRKYPSEEGPAYSILACKAQGLHLQDDNRSKSLDDPLVSASMAESSTNATASASSLSTSPYGSSNPLMSSAPLNGSPRYNNYHYPVQQPRYVHQPNFEGGSRLHSTLAGSPMVETYGENDERFGLNAITNPNSYRSKPFAYDPNEDGKPWDKETPTSQQDRSREFGLHGNSVESDENEQEKDRLQRLKDVYPDQPAIPI
ncbi:hypothetical protein ElyMa_004663700 [Elysia marginata]|uniref:Uncharacterized protein n=1 Tax=Elysia marginata TaxID=1093978 RepID=A0AAV4I537_9GAST|nr:hypothetical protein ElyMa_004663700 [Elysia marginata]